VSGSPFVLVLFGKCFHDLQPHGLGAKLCCSFSWLS
jgi:hypothetical protein